MSALTPQEMRDVVVARQALALLYKPRHWAAAMVFEWFSECPHADGLRFERLGERGLRVEALGS